MGTIYDLFQLEHHITSPNCEHAVS